MCIKHLAQWAQCQLLYECSTQISTILALIYNESLAQGNTPDDWRQANVSPDFKKGEKYEAGNYRPVSITCICKILEHVLVSNINKHLASARAQYKRTGKCIDTYLKHVVEAELSKLTNVKV